MILAAVMLTLALDAKTLDRDQLEQYYWDCDTAFMRGELGGQDLWSCLAITDEFQTYFKDRDQFMEYWRENKHQQWQQRNFRDQST